jgi:hypothetical protein
LLTARGAVATASVVVALLASAAMADSALACNAHTQSGVVRLQPKKERAPAIVGDSTMILAVPYLARRGFAADARGCRQFEAGVGMLAAKKRTGRLPRVAVLALGANGAIAGSAIERALKIMGRNRVLGLVTPRKPGASAQAMRHAARRHPDRVLLIDWAAFSAARGGWFAGDGLHVTYTGAKEFAKLVRRRVRPLVAPPVGSLRLPDRTAGTKDCGKVRRSRRRLKVFVARGRVGCDRARQIARRPRLRRTPRWRYYDWSVAGNGPWTDVYARRDRKAVVGAIRGR